jgi:asparagine synthase (glutamine-hydrolysing)
MLGEMMDSPERFGDFRSMSEPCPERVMPLVSQPAVELFLRIPIYVHFKDGRNRGLGRYAFRNEVPPQILRRTWKDRGPGFFETIVHRNLTFLKDILLDGWLVKQKLLERAVLLEVLSGKAGGRKFYAEELLYYADIESWAHSWSSGADQAAA